jgi:hypothetical protein
LAVFFFAIPALFLEFPRSFGHSREIGHPAASVDIAEKQARLRPAFLVDTKFRGFYIDSILS